MCKELEIVTPILQQERVRQTENQLFFLDHQKTDISGLSPQNLQRQVYPESHS